MFRFWPGPVRLIILAHVLRSVRGRNEGRMGYGIGYRREFACVKHYGVCWTEVLEEIAARSIVVWSANLGRWFQTCRIGQLVEI